MEDLIRHEIVETAKTIVVKVGTNVLARDDDTLDTQRLALLAEQIHRIKASGRQVVVVSSGAVGAGMGLLSLNKRPKDLPHLQAAAATGQAHLIRLYDDCLRKHGYHAAQLLLTANDFKNRSRYLNVRNTLNTLFEYGVVPIINENDTVSINEIKFGDNDHLAAMVTSLMEDPLLIILSTIDGLYDGPPSQPNSQLIPLVKDCNAEVMNWASDEQSSRGTGGMHSKLLAIRLATTVGESVILANGATPGILDQVMAGQKVGTLFLANGKNLPAWKRWIGFTVAPKGHYVLDDGACRAVIQQGKSLLAIGITHVEGHFSQGEVVGITDPNGVEIARGLSNYPSNDSRIIVGKQRNEIVALLGDRAQKEVIHRDNLALLG